MQDRDFEWFKEHLTELYEEYGNAVLAIKNQKVLGAYSAFAEAVAEAAKTEPLGSFIVQECGPDESAYTTYIASVRV